MNQQVCMNCLKLADKLDETERRLDALIKSYDKDIRDAYKDGLADSCRGRL